MENIWKTSSGSQNMTVRSSLIHTTFMWIVIICYNSW